MRRVWAKPRPEDYPNWWQYRQAKRLWLRGHGGPVWMALVVAFFLGALTGSAAGLALVVAVMLAAVWFARSQP
jgi:hypothetical protein